MRRRVWTRGLVLLLGLAVGAAVRTPPPAAGQTSLVMAFVPSLDAQRVLATGSTLARMLEVATGYRVRAEVPTSYAATIEAMCANRVDIAFFAVFSYVLAHQRCGAEARLVSIRQNKPFYVSQILYRADLPVKSLQDLRGKRFAFVDPASASGYLFPAALLKKHGIDPDRFFSQVVFAGGHDKVVIAIYNGSVDAGATFGDPDNPTFEARDRVVRQFPDVREKVKVLMYTDPIPNDTVSFRRGLPEEVKERVTKAMFRIAQTPPGRETIFTLYQHEGYADFEALRTTYKLSKLRSFDEYFQPVRDAAKFLGLNLEDLVRPR
ncbi:MAG: phosphate/phosphite/phosphonate ABC transporter substrate-binding protein [Armatimonadota bacterium]|nr:phosphate/phosphite/phosphonate ABC transporter substrate-binding protein [Armatimonadota bacterium]MDR7534726.1 phosphate/phosphite/phosphonate ABC transporter substrate-binding protein [Armatimonadota bacterium]MDR7536024.1 phosphate/phosphite/phosphonate ABC transporter substrate-binding protein [Armatimonadota bacterium]